MEKCPHREESSGENVLIKEVSSWFQDPSIGNDPSIENDPKLLQEEFPSVRALITCAPSCLDSA